MIQDRRRIEPAGSGARWTSEARPQAENWDVRVKWDNTPEDNGARGKPVRHRRSPKGELRGQQRIKLRHDVTDELAAYKLATLPFPGVFGVFYQSDRPTNNALEKRWIDQSREKVGQASDIDILQKTFDRMK